MQKKKKWTRRAVAKVARSVASKLDKKVVFRNQIQTNFGEFHDDTTVVQMYGRPKTYKQLTLNPYIAKVMTYESNATQQSGPPIVPARPQLVVPYLSTTEVANNDPLQDRLNRRMSDKIWVTGFSFQGQLKLPHGNPEALVQINIVECMTGARHQSEIDNETEFDELISSNALPPITGFQRVTTQEQPLFRKTQKILVNKVYKLKNLNAGIGSITKQFRFKHYLKKPKLLQYMETDISGLHPLNRFWYLSLRCDGSKDTVSTLPDGSWGVAPSVYSPEIVGIFKVFYHDKGS